MYIYRFTRNGKKKTGEECYKKRQKGWNKINRIHKNKTDNDKIINYKMISLGDDS